MFPTKDYFETWKSTTFKLCDSVLHSAAKPRRHLELVAYSSVRLEKLIPVAQGNDEFAFFHQIELVNRRGMSTR